MNFVAFDFETANAKRNSACSLALTVVQNNQIVDELYSLINPKTNFDYRNIAIHGIKPQMVADSPDFSELWPHIESFFTPESLVVAHNAPFDCSVLTHTLEKYGIAALISTSSIPSRQAGNSMISKTISLIPSVKILTLTSHITTMP